MARRLIPCCDTEEVGGSHRSLVRLRPCEWTLVIYFIYVAAISPAFHPLSEARGIPFLYGAAALGTIAALAWGEGRFHGSFFGYARDWAALGLIMAAYREMNWFTPQKLDHRLESYWIGWDRTLLHWGLKRAIESAGPFFPALLELSYLLVYAVGPFTLIMLYVYRRRGRIQAVLFLYILGTLAAYALFPYFPSSPPREIFSGADLPLSTAARELNLFLVGGYGIHSSVFPSAHVSSVFSAAWALLLFLPEKKLLGRGMFIYAALVSIATVYGRYHYAVDVAAGLGVSCAAALAAAAVPGFRPVAQTPSLPLLRSGESYSSPPSSSPSRPC